MRRAASLGRVAAAGAAIGFLDIVSAGFGATLFLFVIFASLPPETGSPAAGGGGSYIDLELQWPRFADGRHEGHMVRTIKAGRPDAPTASEIVPKAIGVSVGELRQHLKEKGLDQCDSPPGSNSPEDWITVSDFVWKEDAKYVQALVNDSEGGFAYSEDCGAHLRRLGRQGLAKRPGLALDVWIVHDPSETQYRLADIDIIGGFDPNTDIAAFGEDAPLSGLQVVGFDYHGRYIRMPDRYAENRLHIRVLNPSQGPWRLHLKQARSHFGQSSADSADPVKVTVKVCPGTADRIETHTVTLDPEGPKRLELTDCATLMK